MTRIHRGVAEDAEEERDSAAQLRLAEWFPILLIPAKGAQAGVRVLRGPNPELSFVARAFLAVRFSFIPAIASQGTGNPALAKRQVGGVLGWDFILPSPIWRGESRK